MITLKGMTWNHIRGYGPLLAITEMFKQRHPEIDIVWDKRSLKDFGDYPVHLLANEYDLIMIDHPHVGIACSQGVLVPLDEHIPQSFLQEQSANSVGPSHTSYLWEGRQWALAVDAAAQVASFRPDLIGSGELPKTWEQAVSLAKALPRNLHIGWPLCPTDAMCSFLTLCAQKGGMNFFIEESGVPVSVGEAVLEQMFGLLPLLHPSSLYSNPIQMYDEMVGGDELVYMPLAFGYSNYSRLGFTDKQIRFTNIPSDSGEAEGSLLGGVGLAVSSFSKHISLAVEFALLTAHSDTQRTLYYEAGGQPGHRLAWIDRNVNRSSDDFFLNTAKTLEHSYMRPRCAAFPEFQERAGALLHESLLKRQNGEKVAIEDVVRSMNRLYAEARERFTAK